MPTTEPLHSIHVLLPLEEGGSVARGGFLYQDHVAAGFCISMLRDPHLGEVWCETEDDVTLLWNFGQGLVVEVVQVKANEPEQLWSVAMLCAGGSDSVLAKSLAHDRCAEPCWFRIVTRANIHSDLQPLQLAREDRRRRLGDAAMTALHRKVGKLVGDALSPRGRSASHWVSDTVWDVAESEQALTDHNRWELQKYLEEAGEPLFTDEMREVYEQLLFRVQQASVPKWTDGPDKKKLQRMSLRDWLIGVVHRIRGYLPSKAGINLERKMNDALIPKATIENADRLRREYRKRTLDPKYQQDEDLKAAELEVGAVLQQLLSDLDAGNLPDDGRQFHARCLNALPAIRKDHARVGLSYLQGALYTATDRCRHRFLRAPS